MIVHLKKHLFQFQHLDNSSIVRKAIKTAVHYYKHADGTPNIEMLAHAFRVADILREYKSADHLIAAAILQHLPKVSKYNVYHLMEMFGIDVSSAILYLNNKQDAFQKIKNEEKWDVTKSKAVERYRNVHNDQLTLMLADDLDLLRQFNMRKNEHKYPVWDRQFSLFDLHNYFSWIASVAQKNRNSNKTTDELAAQIHRYSGLFLQLPQRERIKILVAHGSELYGLVMMRLLSNIPYYQLFGGVYDCDSTLKKLTEKSAEILLTTEEIGKPEFLREVKEKFPDIKIIVIGGVKDAEEIPVMQQYVHGLVGPRLTAEEYVISINRVSDGGYYFSVPVYKPRIKKEGEKRRVG